MRKCFLGRRSNKFFCFVRFSSLLLHKAAQSSRERNTMKKKEGENQAEPAHEAGN